MKRARARRRKKRYCSRCIHFFVDGGYNRCSISNGSALRLQLNIGIKKKNHCRKRTIFLFVRIVFSPFTHFYVKKNPNADLPVPILISLLRLLFPLIAYDIIVWSSDRLIISSSWVGAKEKDRTRKEKKKRTYSYRIQLRERGKI